MSRRSVDSEVISLVADHLGVSADALSPDSRIGDEFSADALDYAELIMTIEEHFGIQIAKDDLPETARVSDLVVTVKQSLSATQVDNLRGGGK